MSRTWQPGQAPWLGRDEVPARARVIVDNDFSGDPDDLVQLAHHLLSPSVDVRAVIGSHLAPGDALDDSAVTAANACARVRELFAVMGLDAEDRIVQGSNTAMGDAVTPRDTPAARAIIEEAMRDDPRPLYVACGGGLTSIVCAVLLEPAIVDRLTVVWIGGPEYPGTAPPPPGVSGPEYNLNIDVPAAQAVFNDSTLPVWQVPRDAYRQCLMSEAELWTRVRPAGPLGRYLYDAIDRVRSLVTRPGRGWAEAYCLGDSPLVLLTALQTFFDPDVASSGWRTVPCPRFDDDGALVPRPEGRTIRVVDRVDTRMMFEDMIAKLAAFAAWQAD